jgi:uncharacterized protein (DUF362 family)
MEGFGRRCFLKIMGLLAALGVTRPGRAEGAQSRVVTVTDGQAWQGAGWADADLDPAVVKDMIVRALSELTDQPDASAALTALIPQIADPNQRYGIKVNCVNADLPSHPVVVFSLIELLTAAGASRENIVVYDRTDYELAKCGFFIGPTVYGSDHSGVGYNDEFLEFTTGAVKLSKILTDRIDHLINVPVLKNHTMAGVTLSLKNHFGSTTRPDSLHGEKNDCSPGIAELNARPEIRDITRLVLIDALFGNYKTGLYGKPDYAPMSIIAATDPVAADTIGQQLINTRRAQDSLEPIDAPHIRDAAGMSLGTNDPANIDHRQVLLDPVVEKPKPWEKDSGCSTASGKSLALAAAVALALRHKNW